MSKERNFAVCKHCGNIIGIIKDNGPTMSCCGEPMQMLQPNTTDAATEKHVPSLKLDGNKLTVTVGEVEHPMTPEHLIEWIAVADGNRTQRVALNASEKPEVSFCISGKADIIVYSYCNLHGLWKGDLKIG